MAQRQEKGADGAPGARSDVVEALFPGRRVPLRDSSGKTFADAVVYPLGVRQVKKFTQGIVHVFRVLMPASPAGAPLDERRLLEQAGPLVMTMLPDLLGECVRIDPPGTGIEFDDLPHWCLPDVARAWIEETFGGDRWRPWAQAFKDLSAALAGGVEAPASSPGSQS